MPFINLNSVESLPSDQPYDVTIIGAGAAGILLALKLARRNLRVMLVEHGHFDLSDQKQSYNEVEQIGKTMVSTVWGRKRAIGGTTLAWGGQSLPFSKLDFKKKKWIALSGWPISYSDLASYYLDANEFMGIDRLDYRDDILKLFKMQPPALNKDLFDYHFSKWAPEANFQKLYKAQLEEQVDVLFNAHLTQIKKEKGRISEIGLKNDSGKLFNVAIKKLILATGGIESVRLLLNYELQNATEVTPNRWLGKAFMEHPCLEIGKIKTNKDYLLQKYFNTRVSNSKKYSVRVSVSDSFQENNKLLNCSISIMFRPKDDNFDPYSEVKLFVKSKHPKYLIKAVASAPKLLKSAIALYRDKFYYKVGMSARVTLMIEQEPSEESYIYLTEETDSYGLKKSGIKWTITFKTWETVVKSAKIFKEEFEKTGLGELVIHPAITDNNNKWPELLCDVNHHMGGARMSLIESDGVVNSDLKVWGTENLYVCSASTFPTSSHSNPTLTLLALATRLVDHLDNKA